MKLEMMQQAKDTLKRVFGYSSFYPLQESIVQHALTGRDAMVVMPTGGGKSLCYQLPALLKPGLTVVISPLIALMQDQVLQLRELGIATAFLNSTLSREEYRQVRREVLAKEIKIVYLAPETLIRPDVLGLLEQVELSLLAIDEAHCISSWGHDFRPEYRRLREIRSRYQSVPCMALTATATPRVRKDIREQLNIESSNEFLASFDRKNLLLAVEQRFDGLAQVVDFLKTHPNQSGIVYCATRQQVEDLAADLKENGFSTLPYHAGLPDETRKANQEKFLRDDALIMVATIAFGMGINKSNVRFVVHFNLCKDLESYYQEIGRSGRDGLPAHCLLLFNGADIMTMRYFINQGAESEKQGRSARLAAMLSYAETLDCRRIPLLNYFGESKKEDCGQCDNCQREKDPAEQTDVTIPAQKFLSCVKRTGEIFGPSHVIDVLRGSKSKRVLSKGHERLSTYGIGLEFSAREWKQLCSQFLGQGLLEQDLEFGGLRLTPKAWEVFKGEKVFARLNPCSATPSLSPQSMAADEDAELFGILRDLRRKLADESGIPAFMVFSDKTLVEMASLFPQTDAQLREITGVGEQKAGHYGKPFLEAIQNHCRAKGLDPSEALNASVQRSSIRRTRPQGKLRHHRIGEMFQSGQSIAAIQAEFNNKPSTVLQHLFRFQQEGGQLNPESLRQEITLSQAQLDKIQSAFETHGLERLGPVREALNQSISYDDLHLIRLYLIAKKQSG